MTPVRDMGGDLGRHHDRPDPPAPVHPSRTALDAAAVPISDMTHVRAVLIASARLRRSLSYSELLDALGHRFSRPKMRAVCKTLDAIDEAARAAREPELAVLVVRGADGLPGQGWWSEGRPRRLGYAGPWVGPEAIAFVLGRQTLAFDYWTRSADP